MTLSFLCGLGSFSCMLFVRLSQRILNLLFLSLYLAWAFFIYISEPRYEYRKEQFDPSFFKKFSALGWNDIMEIFLGGFRKKLFFLLVDFLCPLNTADFIEFKVFNWAMEWNTSGSSTLMSSQPNNIS